MPLIKFIATAPKYRDLRPARRKVFASNAAWENSLSLLSRGSQEEKFTKKIAEFFTFSLIAIAVHVVYSTFCVGGHKFWSGYRKSCLSFIANWSAASLHWKCLISRLNSWRLQQYAKNHKFVCCIIFRLFTVLEMKKMNKMKKLER